MRDASAAAVAALREFLTGPVLRSIAAIRDAGEVILAKVTNLDGGDHLDTEGDADVCVHYQDSLSGLQGIARLYVPGNILFGMPNEGDSAMVLRPRSQHGPGINYLLHGDLGDAARVPSWIRTKVGLWVKDKVLRLESAQHDVELQAGGNIVLQGGTKNVARVTDGVNVAMISGTVLVAGAPVPVQFIVTLIDANGVPGAPSLPDPSAFIAGVIGASGGNPHIKG